MGHPTPPDNNNNNNNDDDYYLVSCRCESARAVSTLLSCLKHARRSTTASSSSLQPVTVYCSRRSLSFHVHNQQGPTPTVQASVDLSASMFSEYDVCRSSSTVDRDEDDQDAWRAGGEFCVNLTTVLECLHVLGNSSNNNNDPTKLFFSYNLTKDIFKLELLDERTGTLCTAAIPGMLPPNDGDDNDDDDDPNNNTTTSNSLALAFRSAPIAARIIVRSEVLRTVLVSELEAVQGASQVSVSLTAATGWSVSAVGNWGAGLVRLPARGAHVVAVEFPTPANVNNKNNPAPEWKYPMHSFLESMRGLEIATETCITINTAGMMAIQHQVLPDPILLNATAAAPSFIDFILCCCFEDEDDEEPKYDKEDEIFPRAKSSSSLLSQSTAVASIRSHAATTVSQASRRRVVSEVKEPISNNHSPNDSDDDDDDDPGSTARLFGSVASVASASSRNVRRRARPTLQNHSSNSNSNNNHYRDDEHDEPPLDVTALASPRRQRRRTNSHREEDDGECSSPELLYGPQD